MHESDGKSVLMVMIELMDAFHLPSYLKLKIAEKREHNCLHPPSY